MPEQDTATVRRFFDEVCNARKLEAADELFAQEHRYHDPSNPWVGPGAQGMRLLIAAYHNAFGDARWVIDETILAGDRVIVRWTARGTHSGVLQGYEATRKTVEVTGIWIFRIANGKIAESWNVWDTMGMMHQLGVLSSAGPASGRATI
jgi:steroid delta-isomerase-like uncharacterized protein